MNESLKITVNGKEYTMPKPKIKLWRHLIRFTEAQQKGELVGEKIVGEMTKLAAMAFDNPDITEEVIEENIDLEEIKEIFDYIARQVTGIARTKSAQLPNGVTPAKT